MFDYCQSSSDQDSLRIQGLTDVVSRSPIVRVFFQIQPYLNIIIISDETEAHLVFVVFAFDKWIGQDLLNKENEEFEDDHVLCTGFFVSLYTYVMDLTLNIILVCLKFLFFCRVFVFFVYM